MKRILPYFLYFISWNLTLSLSASEIYDNSWALIVGINKYEKVRPLSYAIEDASAIKNMLINNFGFPRSNVNVLLNSEATQNNIKKQLNAGSSIDKIVNWTRNLQTVSLNDVNDAGKKYWDHENFYLIVYGNKDSTATFLNQFENVEYYQEQQTD